MKKILFSILTLLLIACGDSQLPKTQNTKYQKTQGFAQGTTWHITYKSFNNEDLTKQFDSILNVFDFSISAYNKESLLTKINNNEDVELDSIITVVFNQSMKIYELSGGLFDPTCRPLVNAWGFAKHSNLKKPSQQEIDSVLKFVGMDKVRIENNKIIKDDNRITLNFNANAQGYSVDLICDYLEKKGYTDYLVEVGGETRAVGKNSLGKPWRVAIESPIDGSTESSREINAVVPLSNKSLCTSGDYRNFFKTDGKKYSHELNPKTGYPKDDSLLSVSIICDKAIDGDALATAVMVMGLEKGFKFIDSLPQTEGYFIYADSKKQFNIKKTNGFPLFSNAPTVILDTDLGSSADDVFAMTMLYDAHRKGEVNLSAVMVNRPGMEILKLTDIINTYYGFEKLPIGRVLNGIENTQIFIPYWKMSLQDSTKKTFKRSFTDKELLELPYAEKLYRKILSQVEDTSAVIFSIGFATNLGHLLKTEADEFSQLSGLELVKKKVKALYIQGGHLSNYSDEPEYNLRQDSSNALVLMNLWPTKIYFSPGETGERFEYIPELVISDQKKYGLSDSPISYIYNNYDCNTGQKMWDACAVLHFLHPECFEIKGPVKFSVDKDMCLREQKGDFHYMTYTKTSEQDSIVMQYIRESSKGGL